MDIDSGGQYFNQMPRHRMPLPAFTEIRMGRRGNREFEYYVHDTGSALHDSDVWSTVFDPIEHRRITMALRGQPNDRRLYWSAESDSPSWLRDDGDTVPEHAAVVSTCSHDNEGWHRITRVEASTEYMEDAVDLLRFLATNVQDGSMRLMLMVTHHHADGSFASRDIPFDGTLDLFRQQFGIQWQADGEQ